MTRTIGDSLRVMRLAIGRRNENDPDSNDITLRRYLNDFIHLTMTDDLHLFEQFGTMQFNISETDSTGVISRDVTGINDTFSNISMEGFITLTNPPDNSVSWNVLRIYQDPQQFFRRWGINNTSILIPGYPTEMLYYGTDMTFRTIPNTDYTIQIYAYKILADLGTSGDPELEQDYWMRYIAYGAAVNYARDFRYDANVLNQIEKTFKSERKLLLTRYHNQQKMSRAKPRF